jgi:lipid-binding SYLF domain-containing protein
MQEAVDAWQRVMRSAQTAVPASVLERAEAIGVFSNVVQAAFIAGGRGGDGVITARRDGKWTAPAFFKLGGASVGAQIGGRRTDIVLVFTSQEAVDALLDDRLEFGAEVTAVAGPNTATEANEASTTAQKGLLVYSRDRGLFAGAALDGTVITPHNDLNRDVYGQVAKDMLRGTAPTLHPEIGQPFLKALNRSMRNRTSSMDASPF